MRTAWPFALLKWLIELLVEQLTNQWTRHQPHLTKVRQLYTRPTMLNTVLFMAFPRQYVQNNKSVELLPMKTFGLVVSRGNHTCLHDALLLTAFGQYLYVTTVCEAIPVNREVPLI